MSCVLNRSQNSSLEVGRSANNNSSPLHAVGLAAIAQLARREPSPAPRAPPPHAQPPAHADFPGVLPTDVVVCLPSRDNTPG